MDCKQNSIPTILFHFKYLRFLHKWPILSSFPYQSTSSNSLTALVVRLKSMQSVFVYCNLRSFSSIYNRWEFPKYVHTIIPYVFIAAFAAWDLCFVVAVVVGGFVDLGWETLHQRHKHFISNRYSRDGCLMYIVNKAVKSDLLPHFSFSFNLSSIILVTGIRYYWQCKVNIYRGAFPDRNNEKMIATHSNQQQKIHMESAQRVHKAEVRERERQQKKTENRKTQAQ